MADQITSSRKIIMFIIFAIISNVLFIGHVFAAPPIALLELSDQMSRAKVSTESNHEIIFKTVTGAGSGTVIKITFPNDFDVTDVDFADMQLFHGAVNPPVTELTLATAAGVGLWGASFTGTVLTLTHPTDAAGDINTDDYIMLKIGTNAAGGTDQIINPPDADNNLIYIEVGPNGNPTDSGKIAVVTVTDDQVVATGFVDAAITCVIDSNESFLGFMSPVAVAQGDTNTVITIGTNANNGYVLFVNDIGNTTNPGLYSTENNYLIGSSTSGTYSDGPTALAGGTEGWGIRASSGNATIDAPYANAGNTVGGLELTQQRLAHHDNQMTTTDQITVYYRAAVATFTPSGRYQDTITYVATARF